MCSNLHYVLQIFNIYDYVLIRLLSLENKKGKKLLDAQKVVTV